MFKFEVWGDFACFTRPELKVERVSYDVITPSAARGLIESIFWHPGLRWQIDKIHVLAPIRFQSIRMNEVGEKISGANVLAEMNGGKKTQLVTGDCIEQRNSVVLRDVHYVIEAHFEMTDKAAPTDNPAKFIRQTTDRLKNGRCFKRPYFGCREWDVHFQEWEGEEIPTIPESRDLGFMLYDMNYSDPEHITPMYYRPYMENGTITVPDLNSGEVFR